MNWVDLLFLGLLLLNLINGYRYGLARQLIGLIGFFVAIAVAVYGSNRLGEVIAGYINPAHLMPIQEVSNRFGFYITADCVVDLAAKIAAFVILLVLAKILLGLLGGTFTAINRLPVLGTVNRLAGLAVGAGKGVILILLLAGLFSLLPVNVIAEAAAGSTFIYFIEGRLPLMVEGLKTFFLSHLCI